MVLSFAFLFFGNMIRVAWKGRVIHCNGAVTLVKAALATATMEVSPLSFFAGFFSLPILCFK